MNRYLTYAMAGTVELISAWLHDGRSEPVEEMRSLLGRVILGEARNGSLRMQVSTARVARPCTQLRPRLTFREPALAHVSYERCGAAAEERPPDLFQQPINETALLNAVMVRRADAVQGE